jgi:hypothetical protein
MALEERGLFATLRWHLWANDSIPRDPAQMARLLGLGEQEVRASLSERVLSFFDLVGDRLVCGELVAQMEKLLDRREKQAEGGRDGARARREKRFAGISTPEGSPQATPVALRKVLEKSRDEKSRGEPSRETDSFGVDEEDVLEMQRAFGERP